MYRDLINLRPWLIRSTPLFDKFSPERKVNTMMYLLYQHWKLKHKSRTYIVCNPQSHPTSRPKHTACGDCSGISDVLHLGSHTGFRLRPSLPTQNKSVGGARRRASVASSCSCEKKACSAGRVADAPGVCQVRIRETTSKRRVAIAYIVMCGPVESSGSFPTSHLAESVSLMPKVKGSFVDPSALRWANSLSELWRQATTLLKNLNG